MIINDEYILANHLDIKGNIKANTCNEKYFQIHKDEYNYLKNRFNDIPQNMYTYKEVINRIKYNIRPVCSVCGSPVNYVGTKNKMYAHTCSLKCAQQSSDTKEKIKNTCLEKYGTPNPMQSEIVKNKSKETCIQKYGVPYSWASDHTKEKIKQTCLKKWGSEFYVTSLDYHNKHDEILNKIILSKKTE